MLLTTAVSQARRNQLSRSEENLEKRKEGMKERGRSSGLSLRQSRRSRLTPNTSVLRKSIPEEKRDRSRNVSSLSRVLVRLWESLRKEKEREREQRKGGGRALTISGSGRLWGQIIGLRPITRWRRRYIEESGYERVPRIVRG